VSPSRTAASIAPDRLTTQATKSRPGVGFSWVATRVTASSPFCGGAAAGAEAASGAGWAAGAGDGGGGAASSFLPQAVKLTARMQRDQRMFHLGSSNLTTVLGGSACLLSGRRCSLARRAD